MKGLALLSLAAGIAVIAMSNDAYAIGRRGGNMKCNNQVAAGPVQAEAENLKITKAPTLVTPLVAAYKSAPVLDLAITTSKIRVDAAALSALNKAPVRSVDGIVSK